MSEYTRNEIVTGDARALAASIPDASVDLVFTDPVYDRIEDYRWLAETAARVLKPGGALLAFCGIGYLDKCLEALNAPPIKYRWIVPVYQPTISRRSDVFYGLWYPLAIAFNGKAKIHRTPRDHQTSMRVQGLPANHSFHWTKDPDVIAYYLSCFTLPGGVVWEPFAGGGTVPAVCKMLGRDFLASEIDPETAARARERLANTQPPLPGLVVEQAGLDLSAA